MTARRRHLERRRRERRQAGSPGRAPYRAPGAREPLRIDRRAGFTLVELLLVMVIVGILAQIAIPNYRALTVRARAVDLVADIEVVEQAARGYQGDLHTWPAESPTAVVPAGMASYLPDGFSFTGEDFSLDWENLAVPGGLPDEPGTTRILGVAVVTGNDELGRALVELLGDSGWYVVGDRYVRIVDRG